MRIIKYTLRILIVSLIWTALIIYGGLINGFLLKRINTDDTPQSFFEASQEAIKKQFVGNLAMTLIEDGKIADSFFYSIDQPVNENTF